VRAAHARRCAEDFGDTQIVCIDHDRVRTHPAGKRRGGAVGIFGSEDDRAIERR